MAELPRELELAVGESWTVELEAAGGGYRWHAEAEGDDGIVATTTEYAGGTVEQGRWRGDAVTVTGLRPGRTDVLVVRRRSWEASGGDGGQTIRVNVRPT